MRGSPVARFLIAGTAVLILLLLWSHGAIPQDPGYHLFADQREFVGIPHAFNLLTNLPFLLFGTLGIITVCRRRERLSGLTMPYLLFFAGVSVTAFGSAYYHYEPTDFSLLWDRLPISVSLTAIFVAIFTERVNARLGVRLLPWLVVAGICSVLYWGWFDDLRPYVLIQFGTVAAVGLLLVICRGPDSMLLWLALGCYGLAKIFEIYDLPIYLLSAETLSGHSLKHLLASLAALMIVVKVRRTAATPAATRPESESTPRL